MKTRLLLTDDHRMFREALRVPLHAEPDLEVIAEASNGKETLAAMARALPDVLVLDIALPDLNGIELAKQVLQRYPGIHVVALSGYSDKLFVEEMLKAGAQAYVLKSSGADELISAIRAVVNGHQFLSPELTRTMLGRSTSSTDNPPPPPPTVLGKREQEVLRLLASGKRSAEIAAVLGIAAATVEVHRRNIRHKLGLHTTAGLTRYAIREGLHTA